MVVEFSLMDGGLAYGILWTATEKSEKEVSCDLDSTNAEAADAS